MSVTFNWDRMGLVIRPGDRVRVLDTGTGIEVRINNQSKILGPLQILASRGLATRG